MEEESAQGHAEGGGVTLQEVEARLRRERELDRLDPKVVEALANTVMRFVQARATTGTWGDLPGPHHHRAAAVWFQSVKTGT
jgi:hypothetical protein